MKGRPAEDESGAYYARYIGRVEGDDGLAALEEQSRTLPEFLRGIGEEGSAHRYAEGKWSLREVLAHVNDAERLFAHRALWFARAQKEPLPSFDPESCAASAQAGAVPWAAHVAEFEAIRAGTLAFYRHLPADAWMRTGVASGGVFTVRALAFIIAGHAGHHAAIIRDKYLRVAP